MAITLLILVVMAGTLTRADDRQQSLASLRKVDDYPLYVMTLYGDYGFDIFLKKGPAVAQPTPGTARTGSACSCFWAAGKDGNAVFGRNFDWHDKAVLLLYTDSPTGHASVSMVSMTLDPKDLSPAEQRSYLPFAPYHPYDGMNEWGLAVGLMAVPRADGGSDPQKVTIGTLTAIRLVLDYAKNVDEAVSLLQDYNISFAGGALEKHLNHAQDVPSRSAPAHQEQYQAAHEKTGRFGREPIRTRTGALRAFVPDDEEQQP